MLIVTVNNNRVTVEWTELSDLCVAVTGYGRAFYVSCVWSAMTWKWSFLLFIYTRGYRRLYEHRTGMCADVGYQKLWRRRHAKLNAVDCLLPSISVFVNSTDYLRLTLFLRLRLHSADHWYRTGATWRITERAHSVRLYLRWEGPVRKSPTFHFFLYSQFTHNDGFGATAIGNGSPYATRLLTCFVLSVTLVYCGQMVRWIKMPLSTDYGGRPRSRRRC